MRTELRGPANFGAGGYFSICNSNKHTVPNAFSSAKNTWARNARKTEMYVNQHPITALAPFAIALAVFHRLYVCAKYEDRPVTDSLISLL